MRTRETLIRAACGSVLSILVVARLAAQNETPNPAAPIEPIAAIIDAFRAHTIVALGDAHGNEQARMFLRSLVRDPRFAVTVNDIVVEFGNARYQGVVDRFVQGENVPRDSVRQIWENTTVANELRGVTSENPASSAVPSVPSALIAKCSTLPIVPAVLERPPNT